jgi:hypothetical protein
MDVAIQALEDACAKLRVVLPGGFPRRLNQSIQSRAFRLTGSVKAIARLAQERESKRDFCDEGKKIVDDAIMPYVEENKDVLEPEEQEKIHLIKKWFDSLERTDESDRPGANRHL